MKLRRFGPMVFVAASLAAPASLLSACAGDETTTPAVDETLDDAGADVTKATPSPDAEPPPPPPKDAGVDPDARGPYDPADVPVVCGESPCAVQIVAGSDHFCARMSDGTVRCWGKDHFGVLGNADTAPDGDETSTVRAIGGLSDVTQLSAARRTNCALIDDGSVKCWGSNDNAQLGLRADSPVNDNNRHPVPSTVPLPSEATRVDVGQMYACAVLSSSGELWCWGRDGYLELLRNDDESEIFTYRFREPGKAFVEPLKVARGAMGDNTFLALGTDGKVYSWGAIVGDEATLAGRIGSIHPHPVPKPVEGLENVTSLAAGPWVYAFNAPRSRAHACAIASGEIYCWGVSYAGALGTGVPGEARTPAHAPFPPTLEAWPQQIAVGDEISCARMTDGSVHCCGSNVRGRLGADEEVTLSTFFTKVETFTGYAVQVATSNNAVCALLVDGTVECWGSNENGELGTLPDDDDHPTPVKVAL